MAQPEVEGLVDRWMSEPAFRQEMRADPEAAVRNAGISLDDEELATLRNMDWSASDEELQARINKSKQLC